MCVPRARLSCFRDIGITKLAEITGENASRIVPEYVAESLGDLVCTV